MTLKKMCRRARFGRLLARALVPAIGRASASEYCVGTVNAFQSALNVAVSAGSALIPTTIKLRPGTYHVGATTLSAPPYGDTFFNELQLQGGYVRTRK